MSLQFSVAVRNARLDAIESAVGASAVLKIRSGAKPAACATADSGTVLSTIALPADWMAAAASGVKEMSGSWSDSAADSAGTAGHFRIYASDGVTCHAQGSITASGGGGEMEIDNTVFAVGQAFSVTAFAIAEPND